MKRCEALFVHVVDVSAALNELVHHHILPVVAGHVQGRVAISIGLIDLDAKIRQRVIMTSLFLTNTQFVHRIFKS